MGIGVLVSIALAYFGYRQAIGVARERAKGAERDLVRTVLKRMFLEHYEPTLKELAHVIDAIGRDRDVPPAYLFTAEGCAAAVWAEALSSDLIAADERARIGVALSRVLESAEAVDVRPRPELAREYARAWSTAIAAGAGSSIVGAAVAVAVGNYHSVRDYLLFLAAAAVGAAASLFAAGFRQNAAELGQTFPSRLTEAKLDEQVERAVAKAGPSASRAASGLDHVVTVRNRRIAVEAMAWGDAAPRDLFMAKVERAYLAALAERADQLIIVTELHHPPVVEPRKIPIAVMSAAALRRYLVGLQLKEHRAKHILARLRPRRVTVTPGLAVLLLALISAAIGLAAASTLSPSQHQRGKALARNGPPRVRAGKPGLPAQGRASSTSVSQPSQMRVPWSSFRNVVDARYVRSCGKPTRNSANAFFGISCTDHLGHVIDIWEYRTPSGTTLGNLHGPPGGCSRLPIDSAGGADRPTRYGTLHVGCDISPGFSVTRSGRPGRNTTSVDFQWYYTSLPQIYAELSITNYSRKPNPPVPDWTTAYRVWLRDAGALKPPPLYLSGNTGP